MTAHCWLRLRRHRWVATGVPVRKRWWDDYAGRWRTWVETPSLCVRCGHETRLSSDYRVARGPYSRSPFRPPHD